MLRTLFLGTGEIALPTLQYLLSAPEIELVAVVTQPDKPAGRTQELKPSAIKLEALARGLPILQPKKVRDPAALEEIRDLAPDLIVVMAYGQILPKALLELPSIACLNLHASLLPKYRGAAPIQAAIEAGERETGITVMYMAEGLDTGDMLLTRSLPIRRRETGGSLHDRLAELAPLALAEALPLLVQRRAPRVPQDDTQATHVSKLTREHGEIDWSQGWATVDRQIRALDPWPGAYTLLRGTGEPRKLKIHSAIIYRRQNGPPGEILRVDRHGILVGTGTGALLLREVQLEGKRRMSAHDFLLGNPVPVGSKLG